MTSVPVTHENQTSAPDGERWNRKRPLRNRHVAQTGVSARMKSLPYINISGLDKHVSDHIPQEMIPDNECLPGGSIHVRMEEICKGNGSRKCVYSYEDKYTFARIVGADSLIFDSHFESANLYSAFRLYPDEPHSLAHGDCRQAYDLYMHNDVNTSQHTQWFYFSTSNTRAGMTVTFFVRNYSKPDSMFNAGMRPLAYSLKSEKGWARAGTDVSYFHLPLRKKKNGLCDYTLSFTYTFEHSNDICYFAFCHPYTYTDLQTYLLKLEADLNRSRFLRRNLLCKTIAGNSCDLVTITAPAASQMELQNRVAIVFTARVHPGETNASWIVHGLLDFLTGDTKAANILRSIFVFKVIPMLNPDGVINGNYRCSLSGDDLNRQWSNPSKELHPTIWHAKELIKRTKRRWLVGLVLDIHGHSRKHGVFTYGCLPDRKVMKPVMISKLQHFAPKPRKVADDPNTAPVGGDGGGVAAVSAFGDIDSIDLDPVLPDRLCSMRDIVTWRVKLLPRIIGATAPIFSLDNCSFRMQRAKASTMRMVVFTELGIDCCYTIEASLAGKGAQHFGVSDLLDMGRRVCASLLTATPSIVPRSSPHVKKKTLDTFTRESLSLLGSDSPQDSSSSKFLEQISQEMQCWTSLFKVEKCVGSGAALLSDAGLLEMTNTAAIPEPDEVSEHVSENDDTGKKKKASKKVKELRRKRSKRKDSSTFEVAVYSKDGSTITITDLNGNTNKKDSKRGSKTNTAAAVRPSDVPIAAPVPRAPGSPARSTKDCVETKQKGFGTPSALEDVLTGTKIGSGTKPKTEKEDTKSLRKLPIYLLLDSVDDAKHSTPDKVSVSEEANRRGYVHSRWDDDGTIEPVGASAQLARGGLARAGMLASTVQGGNNPKGRTIGKAQSGVRQAIDISIPANRMLVSDQDSLDLLTDGAVAHLSMRPGKGFSRGGSVAEAYRRAISPIQARKKGHLSDDKSDNIGSLSARGVSYTKPSLQAPGTTTKPPVFQSRRRSDPTLFQSQIR
eukprot:GSChrysophyteH1.ASY1.ANO1.2817.1 assembled CDS